MIARRGFACALAMAAALLSACAGPRPVESDRSGVSPASEPVSRDDIYILETGIRRFTSSTEASEGEAGEVIPFTLSATSEHGAHWRLDEGDSRSRFWRIDDQDNLVEVAVIEHADEALVLFDPPLVIAPRSVEPGRMHQCESRMRVVSAEDPSRSRASGTATRTLTLAGVQAIDLPWGRPTALRFEIHFQSDLGIAKSTSDVTQWMIEGSGIVRERRIEQRAVLGIPGEVTDVTLTRERP